MPKRTYTIKSPEVLIQELYVLRADVMIACSHTTDTVARRVLEDVTESLQNVHHTLDSLRVREIVQSESPVDDAEFDTFLNEILEEES